MQAKHYAVLEDKTQQLSKIDLGRDSFPLWNKLITYTQVYKQDT